MLVGVQPEDADPDDALPTAHLEVDIRMTHSEPASDPDEAKWEFEQFAAQVKENFEDAYAEIAERVRRNLVKGEFIGKTAFDRTHDDLTATDLKHWHVYDSDNSSAVEFWFRISQNHASAINNLGGKLTSIPNEFKMWAFNEDQEGMIDGLYAKMFGSSSQAGRITRIENPQLNQEMAYALRQKYGAMEGPDDVQQQLALGDRYKQQRRGPPWSSVLQSNSRFIIIPESSLSGGGYRTQLVNWKFEIFVDARSPEDRIEAVKAMVKYFNENPEMVEDAAEDVIGTRFRTIKALAAANKDEVLSGKRLEVSVQRIDSMYAAQVASGSDEWAERAVATAKWIRDNWDNMDEVEKWVGYYKYVLPLATRRLNFARDIPSMEMDDPNNYGKPSTWNQYVKDQLNKLGAFGGTVRDYSGVQDPAALRATLGEPRPAQESVEQQIDRIERLLAEQEPLLQEDDPNYDLRIYSIKVDVSVQKDVGGEVQETQTEIRGIEGVTTVRTVGDTQNTPQALLATYEVKFELVGAISRVKYRDRILIPGLMKVQGLRILRVSPIHRTNVRGTIRTVRENKETLQEYGFGGLAGAVSSVRTPATPSLPTPAVALQNIANDWREGGVMVYDHPMDARDMRYHVMMDVEELWPYISREFRAPMDAFDGMYKNFIRDGATAPVYVAVGKNGRIKITGNEDLVWFAKKSGLEQLPVFLSYQRQV